MRKVNVVVLALAFLVVAPLFSGSVLADPFDEGWDRRFNITINSSEVDSDLTDFPVFFNLSDAPVGFWANVQADGSDIRLVESDLSTNISRELVHIDTSAQTGELWFRTNLSSSTDTVVSLYFSNPTGNEVNDPAVWSNNFSASYRLNGTLDSTSNDRDLTNNGSVTFTDSFIYNGSDFGTGQDRDLRRADDMNVDGVNATLRGWVSVTTPPSAETYGLIAVGGDGSDSLLRLRYRDNGGKNLEFIRTTAGVADDVATHSVDLGTGSFHYVALTFNGSGVTGYLNGSAVASVASSGSGTNPISDLFGIGIDIGPSGYSTSTRLRGFMDEVIVTNSSLSSEWISAEFSNQGTPGTFYAVSNVEERAVTVDLVSPPNDFKNSTTVNTSFVFNPSISSDDAGDFYFNASLYTNESGTFQFEQANQSAILNNTNNTISRLLTDGVYIWSVEVCGNVSGVPTCELASQNFTYTVDTVTPTIDIQQPANNSEFTAHTLNLNFTTTDDSSGVDTSACRFSINEGANTSISNCDNTTFTQDSGVNQTLDVYVADEAGNENSSRHVFTIDPQFNVTVVRSTDQSVINSFTINITNSTGANLIRSTSDGTVEFNFSEAPLGDVDIEVTSTGFNTSTFSENINATTEFNRTYELDVVGLFMQVFDEQTDAQLFFNVTISNSTTQLVVNNAFDLELSDNGTVPTGEDLQFLFSSENGSSYPQRSLRGAFTATTSLNLTGYLLSSGEGNDPTFIVVDESGNSVDAARVTITRTLGGETVTIEEGLTDSAGTFVSFLDPDVSHTVTVSKSGFTDSVQTIFPTQPTYTIVLVEESSLVFTDLLDGLRFSLSTSPSPLRTQSGQQFLWVTSDSESSITNQTLVVRFANGSFVNSTTSSASGGNTLVVTVNMTGFDAGTEFVATGLVRRSSDSEFFNVTERFTAFDARNESITTTLPAIMGRLTEDPEFSPLARALVAMFILLAIMGSVHFVGLPGAEFVGLGVLGFFTYFGWFGESVFIYLVIVLLALVLLVRR